MSRINRQDALQGVTDALRLFPFALAVGICTPFGWAGGLAAAVVCLLFGTVFRVSLTPTFLSVLPVFAIAFRFGASQGCAALLLGGILAFFLSLIPLKYRNQFCTPSVSAGFSVAAAFTATALFTTDYFGIGAVGGTVPAILRDYISLGFHPNWRGILYGTIVMVVLITYPRKFKKLSGALPAVFVALMVTTVLHWILVPDKAHSPIAEVTLQTENILPTGMLLKGVFSREAFLPTLGSALSMSLLMTAGQSQTVSRALCVSSLCGSFCGAVPCLPCDAVRRNRLSAVTAVPLTLLLFAMSWMARIPVPSLAVILIVTGWQSVRWHEVRLSLSAQQIPFFLCAAVLPIVIGIHYAVPILTLLSLAQCYIAPRSVRGCGKYADEPVYAGQFSS